jgi:Mn-dependent DtxR family transcriptional regulator
MELTPGEARYLLTVRDLSKEGHVPSQAQVARALEVSQPTTLEMVRKLRKLDLIEPKQLVLTPQGTSAALVLTSRRAAAKVLAHDVLGLPEDEAEAEAAQLASSVSPALGRRLIAWRTQQSAGG